MSQKTPRRFKVPAIVPNTARSALRMTPLVASIGGLLALAPGGTVALELGAASMRSALGQPLAVEIPYRLAPGEQLTPECIALAPAAPGDAALPSYSRVSRVDVTPSHIRIAGDARVVEPLIGITVDVHCSTAPHFARSYQLFVDPPMRAPAAVADASSQPPAPRSVEARTMPAPASEVAPPRSASSAAPRPSASPRARGETGGSLAQGETYTVVRGDTLSGIAARVADRPGNIRATAQAILAANPAAFTRGNPDLLEAGRSITIPRLTPSAPQPAATPLEAPAAAAATAPVAVTAPTAEPLPSEAGPSPAAPISPPLPTSLEPAAALPARTADSAVQPPEPRRIAVVEASPAPVSTFRDNAPQERDSGTNGRYPLWLTALAAVGAVFLLSTPLLLLRRRRREAPVTARPDPRDTQTRPVIDPAAGIDVVEGRLDRIQANAAMASSPAAPAPNRVEVRPMVVAAPASDTGTAATVDLDIGIPVAEDEHAEWFSAGADVAATAVGDDTLESAATALLPQPEGAHGTERAAEAMMGADDATVVDDEQHTLTIVELDMLRQDYESEHTLTQQTSKALQDAVADLKATQAARAAAGQTATVEMPQAPRGDDDTAIERRRA
jgi:Tfp pilus assembly protein FimV